MKALVVLVSISVSITTPMPACPTARRRRRWWSWCRGAQQDVDPCTWLAAVLIEDPVMYALVVSLKMLTTHSWPSSRTVRKPDGIPLANRSGTRRCSALGMSPGRSPRRHLSVFILLRRDHWCNTQI